MEWLLMAIVSIFIAGFVSGCLAGDGSTPAPAPDVRLQEPAAPSRQWLIVARPRQRYLFPVDNESDALREYFKVKGDPAKIIESRLL